jgi:S1-C subfamily serine protease
LRKILQLPIIRQLHERRLLFPAILGLAVVGVLVDGMINRDSAGFQRPQLDLPLPPITVPSLRPSLEKSPLTYHSDYWWQLAESVRDKLILIGPGDRPAVMVAPGVALTSLTAVSEIEAEFHPLSTGEDVITVTDDPGLATPPYRLLGVDNEEEVALFAVKQPGPVKNFVATHVADQQPGSYVVAVGITPDNGVYVIPGYVTRVRPPSGDTTGLIDFALPIPETAQVAAIVDLDGNLVGVSVQTRHGPEVLAADEIPLLIDHLASGRACLSIEVGDLSDDARRLLGARAGVLVERVVAQAFEPEPSINEGDVLVTWNRKTVNSALDFDSLYAEVEPGELVRYQVVRNRRRISGATRMPGPDCRPADPGLRLYPQIGLSVEWDSGGWRVLRVVAGSPAAESEVAIGDVIVAAGGSPFTEKNAVPFEGFERNPQPVVFTVRRDDRVQAIIVSPASP